MPHGDCHQARFGYIDPNLQGCHASLFVLACAGVVEAYSEDPYATWYTGSADT